MPEIIAFYDPGQDVTCHASVALTGGRCVAISADRRPGGSGGISDTSDGNLVVALPALNGRIFGVASHDAALNAKVNIMRPPKALPIEKGAAGAITAFQEVSVMADGRVQAIAATLAIGFALTGNAGAAGTFVEVDLYKSGSIGT